MFANNPGVPSFSKYSLIRNAEAVATHARPKVGDIVFNLAGLFGIVTATACLALRIKTTQQTCTVAQLSTIHVLVILIFFLAIVFCSSAQLLYFGFGTFDEPICRAAGFLCLAFYLAQRYTLYLFLIERTRIVRAISRPRRADPVYLAGLLFVLVGFAAIGVVCYVNLITQYGSICRIGLHRRAAAALLGWDVFVNVFLTFIFLYHIREYLVEGVTRVVAPVSLRALLRHCNGVDSTLSSFRMIVKPHERLLYVIRKTFWACLAILLSTVATFTILLVYAGSEQAWACLTACTLDAILAVIIIFWLTHTTSDCVTKEPSLNQVSE